MKSKITTLNTIAELDITSFMNLMIVLVPVLLLNMTFSHLKVIDLTLPELSERIVATQTDEQNLEIVVNPTSLMIMFPAGVPLHSIALTDGKFDKSELQTYLKQVKATFAEQATPKSDITLLLHPKSSYQTLVALMESVRSYPEVVAASVVRAALFPDVSLGDNVESKTVVNDTLTDQTLIGTMTDLTAGVES